MGPGGELAAAADFAVVSSFLRLFGLAAQLEPLSAPALRAALRDPQGIPDSLKELYFKLLRRAVKNFRPNDWEKSLIKFCHQRGNRQDAWELERFGYKKSNAQVKLRVLKCLLEYQFVCNAKFKTLVNKMENRDLRLNPIGRDEKGRCYWIQRDHRANMRLYREDQDEETWELIASDRAGLIEVISALKSGKSPTDSMNEPVLNEDSNSVGSSYVANASSGNEIKNDLSPARVEDKNTDSDEISKDRAEPPNENLESESENGKNSDNADDKSQPAIESGSNNNSESNDDTKSEADKSASDESKPVDASKSPNPANEGESQISNSDRSEDVADCVGEEKVEELMIVTGEGNGADCESVPMHYFSEAIEEDVMYFCGEGSGRDCMAGNPYFSPDSIVGDDEYDRGDYFGEEIVEDVMYFYGEGSGYDCMTGNPGADSVADNAEADESAANEVAEDLAVQNNNRLDDGGDDKIENPPGNNSNSTKTNHAEEASVVEENSNVKSEETDGDVKEKGAQSAPLPVTKRFLQNIPKSTVNSDNKSECDTSPSKTKLWTVDSLCGDSNSASESPNLAAKDAEVTNEAVLVNKNIFLDNNKCSITDAPTNNILENNCKSDNHCTDSIKGEGLSDVKSDCEISNNSESQNNVKGLSDIKCENKGAVSNLPESAGPLSEMKTDAETPSQINNDTEKILPVLKDNIKRDETEIEISSKHSNADSDNNSKLDAKVEDVEKLSNSNDNESKDETKTGNVEVAELKVASCSVEMSKNLAPDAILQDNLSVKSPSKHKVDSEIDSTDKISDSKFLPKKIKLGEDNFDSEKTNVNYSDNIVKSETDESSEKILSKEKTKLNPEDSGVSNKKMDVDKVTSDSNNPSIDFSENNMEDMNDDIDDEFCQTVGDNNGIVNKSNNETSATIKIADLSVKLEELKEVKVLIVKEQEIKEPVKESPNVKRTRRSENLKDMKLSDLIKKADNELFSNVHKPAKKLNTSEKKDDDSKEPSKKESKGRKRGRNESESQSEIEELETQINKKVKTKQKILSKKLRKKVDAKEAVQDSSSEEEAEPAPSKGSKKPSPNSKKSKGEAQSSKFKKHNSKKKGSKSKSKEKASEQADEDPPVRQSRRIAQLKIKEEAQRRLMEEKALRELKEKHKKNVTGKEKVDKDWEQDPSDVGSSDEEKNLNVKPKKVNKNDNWQKKILGWNSSSGGNETDSEPGEPEDDFDEQEEEDILALKSDHEFSPESDVEQEDTVPVRRARTLKKEDGEAAEDPDAACVHCSKADHPEWILLCDSCDAGWHASCLKPVLFLVPEGEWFCPPCNHQKLIAALEVQLEELDEHVKQVELEDTKRKKTNQSVVKVKESDSEEDSDEEDESRESNSEESSSSSSSSDDEKIYRLRERRQLPISYRFKEYDQLICSAIKEEYKEDDNSGAGNQGRGKDISTIIEADKEEKKLQQAAQGDEPIDEEEAKRRRAANRSRRRPAKLTSLDVQSDFSDNSDEDFKDAGWSTPSSEAISSESAQSSSSHSSDSMPLRRSLRPSKPSKRKSLADAARSKKRRRRRSSEDDTSEDSTKKLRRVRKNRDSGKRSKKKRKEKNLDDPDNEGGTKGKSKVKYGGLTDDSKSSHDWSPAHRTRQRKYNYMEEPNTESEDEVHKPSGKHMDSSDEYKEESESGSDSDSSRKDKGKSRFFDDDILNLQASKEAYQKQLESSGSDLLKGSLVPVVELANISPVKTDGVPPPPIDRVLNTEPTTTIPFANKSPNRAKRGRSISGTLRKNVNSFENSLMANTILTEEERDQRIAMLKAKGLIKDGDPINESALVSSIENKLGEPLRIPIKPAVMTQFQIEREKKRKEKEEKNVEKEKKKEERLKKKEELQLQKEQRAKEREEKKMARMAGKDRIIRKVRTPEFMGGPGQNMTWGIPIQRPPGNFSQILPQRPPMIHPGMNIRGPMPMNSNQIRMRMEHPNIPLHVQQMSKDGTMSPENRDPMFNYRRHPMENLGPQIRQGESPGSEDMSGPGMPYDDRKDMSIPIEHRLQTYDHMPPDGRKHFPPGARMPFSGVHRGILPIMEGHNLGNRPLGPGYADNMGSSMIRGDVHIRPILNSANDNHNDYIPRNGIPISDLREHPSMGRRPPSAHLDDSSSDNSGQGSNSAKRRGRGPGKKTLARQAAANNSNDGNSPSNSPMSGEGMLTVAGAPQPFRPNVDPPSVITRMPHMMPPPYRGGNMYNNNAPMYGQPRPPLNMGGGYRPHHPHPSHLDPSPSGGGPISMTSPERNSPQNQYPPYPPAPYYPPPSTPPQVGSYQPTPPPHGRFPPQIQGPRSRSPTVHPPPEAPEADDKSKGFQDSNSGAGITIKQEPGITIKQSLSPTEELEEAAANEPQSETSDELPSNLTTVATAPPPRPAHRQLKHTESKSERAGRGRIALTTATRYPQGPYAPQYGPYAPQPPSTDVPYIHNPLHPLHSNIHQGAPQQQPPPMHRPMYPHHQPPHQPPQPPPHQPPQQPAHQPPHPPTHITPIQIPPRPTLTPIQSTEPNPENPTSRAPIPPSAPASRGEDEPSEFGGLVSYFSSQQEDDIDT